MTSDLRDGGLYEQNKSHCKGDPDPPETVSMDDGWVAPAENVTGYGGWQERGGDDQDHAGNDQAGGHGYEPAKHIGDGLWGCGPEPPHSAGDTTRGADGPESAVGIEIVQHPSQGGGVVVGETVDERRQDRLGVTGMLDVGQHPMGEQVSR